MSTAMNIQILVNHPRYISDAVMSAKVAAVDLASEISFPGINPGLDMVIAGDATVILAPGQIQRTFGIVFTLAFTDAYPTDALQLEAFQGLFRETVRIQVPASDVICNYLPVP